MLANFLNKSKPINFIGLLIFFFIAYAIVVIIAFNSHNYTNNLLLKSTLVLVLFLGVFFLYNFIVSKNKLTLDNSYAYFIFTLMVIMVLTKFITSEPLIFTILYLLFLRKIYSLRSIKNVLEKLFDSGFWLGVLFILEPLSILLFVFIYIGVYVHKKITIHTLFTPILGFITPLFLYFVYYFWLDATEKFTNLFKIDFNLDVDFYADTKYFGLIIGLLIITVFTILIKSMKALSINNTFRKSWILLIANFLVLMLFLLFIPNKNGSELILILFPISIILANGIELIQKNIIKNVVLYLFLIVSIVFQFFL